MTKQTKVIFSLLIVVISASFYSGDIKAKTPKVKKKYRPSKKIQLLLDLASGNTELAKNNYNIKSLDPI